MIFRLRFRPSGFSQMRANQLRDLRGRSAEIFWQIACSVSIQRFLRITALRETLHQLVRVAEHTARHHFEQIDVHAVLFAIFLVIIDKIIGRTVEYRAFQRDRRVVGNQIVADRQQIHRTKIRTVLNSWIIGNKRLIWMPLDFMTRNKEIRRTE